MPDRERTQAEEDLTRAETAHVEAKTLFTKEAAERAGKHHAISLEIRELERRSVLAGTLVNEIGAAQTRRQEDANLSDDIHHQRYYFTDEIDGKTVRQCINRLTYWSNKTPGCDITLVFNSPGGSLFDGMMLFDFIQELKERGHRVLIGTYGMCASMAGILLQAGTVRYVGKESWTLIHEMSTGAGGKASSVMDAAKLAERMGARMRTIFLENQAKAIANGTANETMTAAEFDTRWERKDWWLSSDEMVSLGFADRIGSPILDAIPVTEPNV